MEQTAKVNNSHPSQWIVPVILVILAILIIIAAATPGDIVNHGSGPAHKNGVPQYEPMRK